MLGDLPPCPYKFLLSTVLGNMSEVPTASLQHHDVVCLWEEQPAPCIL